MKRLAVIALFALAAAGCTRAERQTLEAAADPQPAARSWHVDADCTGATLDISGYADATDVEFAFGSNPPIALTLDNGSIRYTMQRPVTDDGDAVWMLQIRDGDVVLVPPSTVGVIDC